ncbi:hypothetical protein [Calothrix sp. UHCC 0171]|uniref:hypothetical protein n=1 Tax=Calothrix sp. UHCC 0171 TaxID=3110245 RepID=UPI002B1E9F00|nr:hypothetical protein [Calothrix sp. UHCC 0171]MEA5570911.1 hypothetical protein [Calothrix sp. UHCC 0171]
MFGFIKNLAKKSDNNFYLELKDNEEKKPSQEAKSAPEEKPAQPVAVQPTPATVPTATSNGKPTKKEDAAPAKSAKVKAAKGAKGAKAAQVEKKVEVVKPMDPAELAAAAVARKPEKSGDNNFATKYLLTPSTNGRRRPGANMNAFLEMARTVKTPVQK